MGKVNLRFFGPPSTPFFMISFLIYRYCVLLCCVGSLLSDEEPRCRTNWTFQLIYTIFTYIYIIRTIIHMNMHFYLDIWLWFRVAYIIIAQSVFLIYTSISHRSPQCSAAAVEGPAPAAAINHNHQVLQFVYRGHHIAQQQQRKYGTESRPERKRI